MKKSVVSRRKEGFTLVELVIVIAVIAVLSAVLIPTFGGIINNAKVTSLKASLNAVNENLLIRSLNDNRSSYSADEIKQVLEDLDFDRSSTPEGYSLWYDKSVNNIRLFSNKSAFSSASPSADADAVKTVYAADAVIQKGDRPIEALNPYNRNLYYIDDTIKDITNAINEIKGGTTSGIVSDAEDRGSSAANISALIKESFTNKLAAIVSSLNGKNNYLAQNDLVAAFDIDNTLFIGNKGMYLPSFDSSSSDRPTVTCTNSLVDGSVFEITNQGLSSGKSAANLTVNVTIVIPAKVTLIEGSAFSKLGENGESKVKLEIGVDATFNESGISGASITITRSTSVVNENLIKYGNADIVYGRDYTCEYPDDCQYMYVDKDGMKTGRLTSGQTLNDVGNGVKVKYLVPVFNILVSEDGFFKSFNNISKLYVNSVKSGSVTKYNAIILMRDGDVVKGWKFSNVGYPTGLNMYTYENYDVINHRGNKEAFPQTSKATIKVALANSVTGLDNYLTETTNGKRTSSLNVKVTYKPVVNVYRQDSLLDGTVYYSLNSTTNYTGDALVGEAVYDEALSAFKLEISSNGMTLGDYCTYSAVVEKVEVYAGEKLILVRNY